MRKRRVTALRPAGFARLEPARGRVVDPDDNVVGVNLLPEPGTLQGARAAHERAGADAGARGEVREDALRGRFGVALVVFMVFWRLCWTGARGALLGKK